MESPVALFTDGSCWQKKGGFAWLAFDVNGEESVGMGGADNTTNNRMEMMAWIDGLNSIHASCGPSEILLYSDSEYVGLGAMNKHRARNKNVDLWLAIDEAIDKHSYVEFIHVLGHQKKGSYYNDVVDQMAGEARRAWESKSDPSRIE